MTQGRICICRIHMGTNAGEDEIVIRQLPQGNVKGKVQFSAYVVVGNKCIEYEMIYK